MINLQEAVEFAKKICTKSGNKLAELYNETDKLEFQTKSKNQIVSKADLIAEEILVNSIKQNYPNHSILSEEEGSKENDSNYLWIIDPLDGTTNFSVKMPFFNSTVALTYKDEIILGAVYSPLSDELYWAGKNLGAFLNNKKIKTSSKTDMKKSFHAFCYGDNLDNSISIAAEYYKYNLNKGYKTRQLGSAGLELARIADGTINSMVIPGAKLWDIAAGVILVREAGGVVKGWEGEEFTVKSKGIIAAANPDLLQEVKKEVEKIKKQFD